MDNPESRSNIIIVGGEHESQQLSIALARAATLLTDNGYHVVKLNTQSELDVYIADYGVQNNIILDTHKHLVPNIDQIIGNLNADIDLAEKHLAQRVIVPRIDMDILYTLTRQSIECKISHKDIVSLPDRDFDNRFGARKKGRARKYSHQKSIGNIKGRKR
jgi:hypothetical protein